MSIAKPNRIAGATRLALVSSCQTAITGKYLVIQNPEDNYAVVPGPIFNSGCSKQFGNTVILRTDENNEGVFHR